MIFYNGIKGSFDKNTINWEDGGKWVKAPKNIDLVSGTFKNIWSLFKILQKLYPKKELNRIYLIDNFDLQLSSLQNVMCYVYTYNIVCGYIK